MILVLVLDSKYYLRTPGIDCSVILLRYQLSEKGVELVRHLVCMQPTRFRESAKRFHAKLV